MNRRTLLATSAATVSLPLVGCVGTTSDPETPSETAATPHDLYLVNYTATTEIATVHIVSGDGAAVVDGRYELPSERGLEFEGIGAWERTYTVELTIADTALDPMTWETASCETIEGAPRGSRDGYVYVPDDESDGSQATLFVDDCDAIIGPEYPTGPAQGSRVAE
jgi:hypothetical protein